MALASTALTAPTAALAQSVVLQGDYLKIGINEKGTLGTGGTVRPGILYDGTGAGTFNPSYDYLTPGTPQEAFVLTGSSAGGGAFTATNSNASLFSASTNGTLTSYNGVAYNGTTFDQRVVWTGTYGSTLSVTHDYRFNTNGQQLQISTTITALDDLTGLSFVRLTDPDAVAAPGDTSATNNFQGSGSVPGTDLIYAEATVSKYVIGLYSNDATPHHTAAPGFTANPAGYLAGTFLGNGDYTIGMAFTIGSLTNGSSLSLNYSYIFGTDIAAAVSAGTGGGGGGSPAPEPTNISSETHYTADAIASGKVKPEFDGGVLTLASTGALDTNFTMTAKGGGIDTSGFDLTLSGAITGDGQFSKKGAGVLTLKGANTFKGLSVEGGTLAFGDEAALGASDATLSLSSGGGLQALSNLTLSRNITIDTSRVVFDTHANDVTLAGAITGSGELMKTGAGVLTLTGANTFKALTIGGGALAFSSDAALGAADSTLTLKDGGGLKILSDLTFNRNLVISGAGGVDTGASKIIMSGDILGGGDLQKTGAGALTLAGQNEMATLHIKEGAVIANAAKSLGAADGKIILEANTSLTTGGSYTITQAVDIIGANARFDTGANAVTLLGAISGDACFIKAGSGKLDLRGAGANAIGACVQQGQLSFNNSFIGNVFVDPGATVSGSGMVRGAMAIQGILAPGNSPGRLVVAGSVTQAAGSTLAIDIDGPTAGIGAGHFDTLVLTGAGSVYTAAGTIAPITRGITGDATNTYTPRIGDTYQVVTADGGVTGAFASVTQPTTGLPVNARFDVAYTRNAVILAVTPRSYAAMEGATRNASAVGEAADRLRTAGANAFTNGLIGLNAIQIGDALQRAAGEIHADGVDAVLQSNRALRAATFGRLAARDGGVWGQAMGATRKVGSDETASSYRTDRAGVVFGADRQVSPAVLVGGAVGYTENEVKAGVLGTGRTFSYQGLAYAGWTSGDYYFDGVAAAGSDLYKAERTIAYAKPKGHSLSADVEAGRKLAMGPAAVTLAAGLSADQVKRKAVTESGGAITALTFDNVTRRAVQARVGGRVASRTAMGDLHVTPHASVFVLRELNGARSRLDAHLLGQAFEVATTSPGKTSLQLAAGVDAQVNDRARLTFGYKYEGAREVQSHAVALTGALAW